VPHSEGTARKSYIPKASYSGSAGTATFPWQRLKRRTSRRTASVIPFSSAEKFLTNIYSFARESMHLRITRDALGDEDPPDEFLARELALDKELVQLIQSACKNDKLPRALELTHMLHHTSSFDMAAKVAAFYRLVGLQEKMQALKDDRVASGRPRPRDWARDYDPVLPPRLPPADVPRGGSRAFQDFGPPAAVHRPGLARATPSLPPLPKDDVYSGTEDYAALPSESKRKRAGDDSIAYGDSAALPDYAKRRAVEDDEAAALPLPKPSPHIRNYLSLSLNLPYRCKSVREKVQ
jgi:chromosome transmission fidelity protein 4